MLLLNMLYLAGFSRDARSALKGQLCSLIIPGPLLLERSSWQNGVYMCASVGV